MTLHVNFEWENIRTICLCALEFGMFGSHTYILTEGAYSVDYWEQTIKLQMNKWIFCSYLNNLDLGLGLSIQHITRDCVNGRKHFKTHRKKEKNDRHP